MKTLPSEGRASARRAPESHLGPREKRWRIINLVFLPTAFAALIFVGQGTVPKWFPFATSCGAFTGLPCIFCGITRGLHHLLHGEFGRALYFNWLAFPLLAAALTLFLVHALELLFGRRLLARMPRVRLTRKSLGGLFAGLVFLWCLQVYLAISQYKTELLNPHGPLYSLVVR